MFDIISSLADAIVALNNASPRLPTKAEIEEAVRATNVVGSSGRVASMRPMSLAEMRSKDGVPLAERPETTLLTADDLKTWADTVTPYTTTMAGPPIPAAEFAYGVRVPDNPLSVAAGTDALAQFSMLMIAAYQAGAAGNTVIWRIKPDMDSWTGEIVEYRDDGPDICNLTDRRCVKDYSHRMIKVRWRIAVDNCPPGTEGYFSIDCPILPGWEIIRTVIDDNRHVCVKK